MDQVHVSLDDSGRILIPTAVQRRLGLLPGMSLVVEKGEGDKAGVLVVQVEPFSDLTNVTRRERDRRVFDLLHLVRRCESRR